MNALSRTNMLSKMAADSALVINRAPGLFIYMSMLKLDMSSLFTTFFSFNNTLIYIDKLHQV